MFDGGSGHSQEADGGRRTDPVSGCGDVKKHFQSKRKSCSQIGCLQSSTAWLPKSLTSSRLLMSEREAIRPGRGFGGLHLQAVSLRHATEVLSPCQSPHERAEG